MSAYLILSGQLLGTAFACGLNLYATILLLGVASRLELMGALPPGLRGLENGLVLASAAGLYLFELIIDRVPFATHAWEAIHTLIRPAAAALLTWLAFQPAGTGFQIAAATAAGLFALASHAGKAGLRLTVQIRAARAGTRRAHRFRNLRLMLLSLGEDLLAVGIAFAALIYPGAALVVIAAAILALLLAGPRLWRAAILALRASHARFRGFFHRADWAPAADVPRDLRAIIPAEPVGQPAPRAARAALTGYPRIGPYRNGWLVICWDGPCFLYRHIFRPRRLELRTAGEPIVHTGLLVDALDLPVDDSRRCTLFLLKDGPPADQAARALAQS